MHVVVVGAGPSGLLLSLLLGKAGIEVTLLDGASTLDNRPRAAHYAPSAIRELKRAGVLDDVREKGFVPGDMCFRKLDGSLLARLKNSSQREKPEALTVLPLDQLGKVLLSHVEKLNNVTVKWDNLVTGIGQDEKSAWADVKLPDGTTTKISGDYVCGCDGANSQVRRSLFGDLNYPGKTWDAQIVATNVYYPFEKYGYEDINFIINNEHYYMAARITNDGMWRVSYGEDTKLSLEEIKAHQPWKYEHMLPGSPKIGDYKLTNVGPYRIHQRCAEKFRVGRICLAADAAHLCNPFGGLGLTGGIVDVGGLSDCLNGIATGQADDSILDKYDEIRRHLWKTVIDPVSSSNFLRVSATDPETAAEKDEFLATITKANKNPKVKEQVDQGVYAICHDFTQYYKKPNNAVNGVALTT